MVCLETSFLVDILRGKEQARQLLENLEKGRDALTIASPSIMELVNGAILNPKVKNEKDKVISFLSSFSVLTFDKDSSIMAGEIEADLTRRGQDIETEDIMIGAIAKQNGEKLITKNIKHFERIKGLEVQGY